MKKLLVLLLTLMALCTLTVGTSVALAEETEVTEETSAVSEDKEIEEKLSEAVAKLNELTGEDNFFKNKVLPYIISGGVDLLLVSAIVLRSVLKNKSKAEKLEILAAKLSNEKDTLTTLLTSNDPEK